MARGIPFNSSDSFFMAGGTPQKEFEVDWGRGSFSRHFFGFLPSRKDQLRKQLDENLKRTVQEPMSWLLLGKHVTCLLIVV